MTRDYEVHVSIDLGERVSWDGGSFTSVGASVDGLTKDQALRIATHIHEEHPNLWPTVLKRGYVKPPLDLVHMDGTEEDYYEYMRGRAG